MLVVLLVIGCCLSDLYEELDEPWLSLLEILVLFLDNVVQFLDFASVFASVKVHLILPNLVLALEAMAHHLIHVEAVVKGVEAGNPLIVLEVPL